MDFLEMETFLIWIGELVFYEELIVQWKRSVSCVCRDWILKTQQNRGKNVKLNKVLPLVKEFEVHMAKISSQASPVCAVAY